MQFTTLFAAVSLLASSHLATAYPHGDHPPSASTSARCNTTMSRGYAGYEVSVSMPYPKPTGTGSPHPPGCMCSHCRPAGNGTYSMPAHANRTTSTTKVRVTTMVDTPAFTSFPAPSHTPQTKTVVHTTYVDAPAFTSFQPAAPVATATASAMPHHPHARSEAQAQAPEEQAEEHHTHHLPVRRIVLAGLFMGLLLVLIGLVILGVCLRFGSCNPWQIKQENGKWYGPLWQRE